MSWPLIACVFLLVLKVAKTPGVCVFALNMLMTTRTSADSYN